ncbi:purine and uridine phosphorylase [Aspergillus campestris IBT 28561]|uniref:Purine and uridine phosphorylase n=1 Tax=Aspergillus campestris (strain IBT 28561) TaxID=1392248 RepID=A0A2I1CVS6_ASPC2|nr:purine and uridine phosphorylase [Aspergillus campestris IBT 28561]PKY01729.1 purine and uridine phosphorylase [Aspergillus campestris IBT 28561]
MDSEMEDLKPLSSQLQCSDYTVGWICALPKEQTAATAMLDHIHPDLPKPPNDPNTYTLGSIGKHNIVVACLPKGRIGNNSAAISATQMIRTFLSIKVGLMVGIGGGLPTKTKLGDVVIGAPVDQYPGVVQWDLGKTEQGGDFRRIGSQNSPPNALLTALAKMETRSQLSGSKIPDHLKEMEKKWPNLMKEFTCPALHDELNVSPIKFRPGSQGWQISHASGQCKAQPEDIRVHYGLIASGNQVIKDAELRDLVDRNLGGNVLCVEMEAAGLMNIIPCIVIRGICDYADSKKIKDWQEYAASVAAACAKELLEYVHPSDVNEERPVQEILGAGKLSSSISMT